MTARFSPHLFRTVLWTICLTFLVSVSLVSDADATGPVFPDDAVVDMQLDEPLVLPKRNPLLQRPKTKQVVFDDLDPVGSIVSQDFLQGEEEFEIQPMPVIRRRLAPQIISNDVMADFDHEEMLGEYPMEMGGYVAGPICQTFGVGLFDNLTLFTETTAFKTELNNGFGRHHGSGSFGLSEGINWSTPITPQGTISVQAGVRAVQGDIFSQAARSQTFTTMGVFKRLDFHSVQGGVAIDWLHDHSHFGSVDVRQMRAELSTRTFRGLEYGFTGAFDVFQDRPTTRAIDWWARARHFGVFGGAVDVQDYYLLFVRKHLDSGGQVEFRCGATEQGDLILGAIGEAAISDRLAVNGGFTVLAPSEGQSIRGNERESWSMSLGVVLYFRGGAMSRQANLHRPMFDVAGNNSFFTRIIGR